MELDFILHKAACEDYIQHVKVEEELDLLFWILRVWSRRKEFLIILFKASETIVENWQMIIGSDCDSVCIIVNIDVFVPNSDCVTEASVVVFV